MKIYLENAKCRSKKTFFFLFKNRGKGIWPSQKPFCLPPPRQKILETSLWCTQDPATGTQYHIAPNRKLWHQPYIASLISFAANANIWSFTEAWISNAFKNGFPDNWHDLFREYVDDCTGQKRGESSSSENRHVNVRNLLLQFTFLLDMDDARISNCHQFKNGALLCDGSMGPFKNQVNVKQIILGILGIKRKKTCLVPILGLRFSCLWHLSAPQVSIFDANPIIFQTKSISFRQKTNFSRAFGALYYPSVRGFMNLL